MEDSCQEFKNLSSGDLIIQYSRVDDPLFPLEINSDKRHRLRRAGQPPPEPRNARMMRENVVSREKLPRKEYRPTGQPLTLTLID